MKVAAQGIFNTEEVQNAGRKSGLRREEEEGDQSTKKIMIMNEKIDEGQNSDKSLHKKLSLINTDEPLRK